MAKAAASEQEKYDKLSTLVLQGGGALGAYQGGVYQSLAEGGYDPDWVAGISIGAINAAIIAGNDPALRIARLTDFWDTITLPSATWPNLVAGLSDPWHRQAGALSALTFGQPGFFDRWDAVSWCFSGFPSSWYDTAPLRQTLERLVDFDRINAGHTRLSLGAVNVRTGNMVYFDSREMAIRPEHVMASGALPPGFPPVEIDGEIYWDGGLVSNTPLEYVLSYYPRRSRLVFQVDLFPPDGPAPRGLDEVMERATDIRYASRTISSAQQFRAFHDIRHNLNDLIGQLTPEQRALPAAAVLAEIACVTTMDIARIAYRPDAPQGANKDYVFTRDLMRRRWERGARDGRKMLAVKPWLAPMPPRTGARLFELP